MIGIPLALLAANATEWVVHKYVLHGLGKKKSSFWAFHWHEHHAESRRHVMRDPFYAERSVLGWHAQGKEAVAVFGAAAAMTPLLPVAPFFVATSWYAAWNYYRKHKRSHADPEWAREHLTWHYDHHMGPKQDANWCVTRPWFDHLMGTRVPYAYTDRERKDRERRAALDEKRAARAATTVSLEDAAPKAA